MSSSSAKTFACPSCGAPLSPQGNAKEVKCPFCGTVVEVPSELRSAPTPEYEPPSYQEPQRPVVIIEPQGYFGHQQQPIMMPPPRRRGGCGCFGTLFAIFMLLIILSVGLAVASPALINSLLSRLSITSFTSGSGIPPVITSFVATPNFVAVGGQSKISWTSFNVDSVNLTVSGAKPQNFTGLPASGAKYVQFDNIGKITVTITGIKDGQTVSQELKVTVNPAK